LSLGGSNLKRGKRKKKNRKRNGAKRKVRGEFEVRREKNIYKRGQTKARKVGT
jgi:hypothetical protein